MVSIRDVVVSFVVILQKYNATDCNSYRLLSGMSKILLMIRIVALPLMPLMVFELHRLFDGSHGMGTISVPAFRMFDNKRMEKCSILSQ